MELQVTITLSDRLFVLLEDKLPNLGRRVEKAITKELGAQTRRESSIAVSVSTEAPAPEPAESDKPRRTHRAKADAPETSAPVATAEEVPQPEATEQAAESKPFAEAPVQRSEKTSGEMIREIMHRTRQRFEGEDYKENAESEAYKKYHRALTSQFKQIAITLGYEKPSYIDNPEGIAAFAAECDALIIDEKGFITPPQHPTK